MSLVKLMRRNWKSSTLYLTVSTAGLAYYYDYTLTNDVMQSNCRRAARYGEERLKNPNDQVRHITVILNPVANKRKSKKLYNKWVEPLLHLSGIKVSLVETDHAGQEYNLMEIMSNCDGVAIVGGDGSVHEAVNGLLSRADAKKAAEAMPLGIIPTGQNNSIARYVHQNHVYYRNQKEFLIHATMKLIESCTQKFDALKLETLEQESSQQKPTYALRDVRYGLYQDNFYKVSGYAFYQKYIKPIWLRIRPRGKPPRIEKIDYTTPGQQDVRTVQDVPEVTDFRACMMGYKKVRLSLGRNYEYNPSDITEAKDVQLKVDPDLDKAFAKSVESQENSDEQKEKVESDNKDEDKLLIDGQPSQAHSITISAIENAVTVFTGPHKTVGRL